MAELTNAELTQGRESTRLPHTAQIYVIEKCSTAALSILMLHTKM